MTHSTKKIAVAISGSGRTLKNLIAKSKSSDASYKVTCVISSNKNIYGNQIAQHNNLPLFIGDFRQHTREKNSLALCAFLEKQGPDLVALAGFLASFPLDHKVKERVINIHPALLPLHGGKGMYGGHVHEAVIAAGDLFSGATVHKVTEEYDKGRILGQAKVRVATKDPEALADMVFEAECDLYPKILNRICLDNPIDLNGFRPINYMFTQTS
jgi:phosphoribosylglycinamide formyltransferase-1